MTLTFSPTGSWSAASKAADRHVEGLINRSCCFAAVHGSGRGGQSGHSPTIAVVILRLLTRRDSSIVAKAITACGFRTVRVGKRNSARNAVGMPDDLAMSAAG